MRLVILIVIIFLFELSYSQYKNGFIVLESGDTVQGLIKDDSPEINSTKVKFQSNSGEKIVYKAEELISFKRGDEVFVKIAVDTINKKVVKRLSLLISSGTIDLFRYETSSPMGGIGGASGSFSDMIYYIRLQNGSIIKVLSRNYNEIIDTYFHDRKIANKKYKYDNIEKDFNELNK